MGYVKDLVKTVNNISTCTFRSYDGSKVKAEFKCLDCSCQILYRHKIDYKLSFWEGSLVCRNCKKEVNYYSDDWIKTIITEPFQANLF